MTALPRGISPDLLLSQITNTMPYLLEESGLSQFPPVLIVKETTQILSQRDLTHLEYFKLCVSAHFLTCATPVPTDVDNQIRKKLWPDELPCDLANEMAEFVLEVRSDDRSWDDRKVSSRYVHGASGSAWENESLGGHSGEWFTLAAAAYCALSRYSSEVSVSLKKKIFDAITHEVLRHSEIFGSLVKAGQGLICLKASANISHNLGDLDRVMDMWELFVADPLRTEFYKLGATPFDSKKKLRYSGRLWLAGELYKTITSEGHSTALENHRHFALRKPRCLRRNIDFLVPNGPFFDAWGKTVAQGLAKDGKPSEETLEVIDALVKGWTRLPKTVGYGRALHGILEAHPELSSQIEKDIDKKDFALVQMSQEEFELKWEKFALEQLDEIPARA